MNERGFALFETAIGPCAVAWGRRGVVGLQLPEGEKAETRARVVGRFPDARETEPPPTIRRVVADVAALLTGEPRDLTGVVVDLADVPAFERRVYAVARAIPPGATLTYGAVAARLGMAGAARAVGRALARNPFPIVVPCHRIVAAGGRAGGFSAGGGVGTKLRLLAIEGARPTGTTTLFDVATTGVTGPAP